MMMMISNAVCLSVRPSVGLSFCLERQRRLALRSWESSESESEEVGGICEGESEEGEREGAKKGHYTATIHPTQLREGDSIQHETDVVAHTAAAATNGARRQ